MPLGFFGFQDINAVLSLLHPEANPFPHAWSACYHTCPLVSGLVPFQHRSSSSGKTRIASIHIVVIAILILARLNIKPSVPDDRIVTQSVAIRHELLDEALSFSMY